MALRAVSYFHILSPVLFWSVFWRAGLCRLLSQAPLPAGFQLGRANRKHWGRLRVKAWRGQGTCLALSRHCPQQQLQPQLLCGSSLLQAGPQPLGYTVLLLCLCDVRASFCSESLDRSTSLGCFLSNFITSVTISLHYIFSSVNGQSGLFQE